MPLRVLKNALFAMDVENLTSPLTNFLKLGPLLRQSMSISVRKILKLYTLVNSKMMMNMFFQIYWVQLCRYKKLYTYEKQPFFDKSIVLCLYIHFEYLMMYCFHEKKPISDLGPLFMLLLQKLCYFLFAKVKDDATNKKNISTYI